MKKFNNFNVICRECGATDSTDVNYKIITRRSGDEEFEIIVTIYCKCGNEEVIT